MLLKHNTVVNATDKWGFTPLHEGEFLGIQFECVTNPNRINFIAAAQKGRTQLCSLLLAHGADPFMKNQENQTPIELASAEDVKCLLQDAMTMSINNQSITTAGGLICGLNTANQNQQSILVSPSTETETVTLPTGASMTLSVPVPQTPSRSCLSPAQGAESHADGTASEFNETDDASNVASFLIR